LYVSTLLNEIFNDTVTSLRTTETIQPVLSTKEEQDRGSTGKKSRLSRNIYENRTDDAHTKPNGVDNSMNISTNATKINRKLIPGISEGHYDEINNLEVAVEYLRCFVIESGTCGRFLFYWEIYFYYSFDLTIPTK